MLGCCARLCQARHTRETVTTCRLSRCTSTWLSTPSGSSARLLAAESTAARVAVLLCRASSTCRLDH